MPRRGALLDRADRRLGGASWPFLAAAAAAPTITSLSVTSGSISGGTTTVITGTNFRTGVGVWFGTTAAASVTRDSATQLTVVTPAHAAAAVDVTVTNIDSHTVTSAGAFTFSAVFDPATLSLSLWVRAAYAGSPWTGVASAGGSGSRNLTGVASHTPTAGSPLNGLDVAVCDWATGQGFTNATAIGSLITATAWSASLLVYPAAVHNNSATAYLNDCLIDDAGGSYWGLFLKANGGSPLAQAFHWHGGDVHAEAAISTGAWSLVQAKYDGTNLKIRVNSGSWASTAAGSIDDTTNTLRVLYNGNALDGRCAEIMLAPAALSDANFDNIKSYVNSTYGLSL